MGGAEAVTWLGGSTKKNTKGAIAPAALYGESTVRIHNSIIFYSLFTATILKLPIGSLSHLHVFYLSWFRIIRRVEGTLRSWLHLNDSIHIYHLNLIPKISTHESVKVRKSVVYQKGGSHDFGSIRLRQLS